MRKRRHKTMRIPESVMIRIHERLRNPLVWMSSNRGTLARMGKVSRPR
jgi:hypothetical protein